MPVKMEDKFNAFLTKVSDEHEKVKKGPLAGMTYALKDNILYEGIRSTAGSKILENYIAPYDATVVKKLKSSGAIFRGKTNLDEFAMGSSTENSAYGAVKNPWNVKKVPGGSSGGSAAAVASGMVDFALGSDTGGSIRQPASFCVVVGLKPTYGRVSRYGLMAMASSLDQIGTFTSSVEDAAKILQVIGGHDELDATTSPDAQPNYSGAIKKAKKMIIGVPKEYFGLPTGNSKGVLVGEGVDPGVAESVRAAIALLEKAGHKIKEISLPHTKYALAAYYIIMPVEVASNLSRYDGIKYGYSVENEEDPSTSSGQVPDISVIEVTKKSRAKGFGAEAKRRIMLGTYASSAGYYDAYYKKAQQVKALVMQDFDRAFKEVDVIASPTTPEVAFNFGAKTADPVKMYYSDALTVPANIAGIPAISIPCSLVDGLPVGLQFMAPHFAEDRLFNIGSQYEKLRGPAETPEGVFAGKE